MQYQYPSIVDALENATTYHGLTLTETTSLADGILLEPLTDRLSTTLTNVDEHVGSNRSEQEYGSYPWRGALQQDDPRCRASSASSSLVFATQREAWNMQASPFANSSRFPRAYGSSSQYLAGYCPPYGVDIPTIDDSVDGIFSPRVPYNAHKSTSSTSYGALNYPSLLPVSLAPPRHSPTLSDVCASSTLAFGCTGNSIESVVTTDASYCLGVEEIEALRGLLSPLSSSSFPYSPDRESFFQDPERSLLAGHPGADISTCNNRSDSGAWWQHYATSPSVYSEAGFNLGPMQYGAEDIIATSNQNVEPYEDGHSNVPNTVTQLAPETVNGSIPTGLGMRQTIPVDPALDDGPLWTPAFVAETMVNVVPESSQLSVPSSNSASERSQWAKCPWEDRIPVTQVDAAAGNSALKAKKEDKESGKADGKQPFRCLAQNPCGKRFGRVEEARRHFRTARVHADERSAEQRSASEGARNDAERPFKRERERCGRAYSRRDGLQRHCRRHHRDGEEVQGIRDGRK
ncbi:uncharacterized protein LAESUDRAFT_757691 [Laetiporus sulphureus 93-53]|uniref:C2H2-type domain-containing protein n=1 Tax=Laetiporus sulphureus 93-53 TaxID=1314785 RepID=A0A165F5Y3_9APHY|nr:uncharacterized protein LAESUDRAFT_757691 [Laetiporus sulphureus 93-53]KZT08454.1 hypothetical protein LAESUDRAFT_757691 [Laetiporus sulphureus 93-53]